PGEWEKLPASVRATYTKNAHTWADEIADPSSFTIDLARLAAYRGPLTISTGTTSPPFFRAIVDRIAAGVPSARVHRYDGAGHVPYLTHAKEWLTVVAAPS